MVQLCLMSGRGAAPRPIPVSVIRRCGRCHALAPRAQQEQPQSAQQQQERSGPSGLNVGRFRPTSSQGWADMATALRQANVRVVAPQELPWVKEKGAVLVDIRPAASYSDGHLVGAASVPFYRQIEGWTPWKVARRVGYAMFGIAQGTEPNPDFIAEITGLVADPESTPVVVYCNLGGSLEQTKNDKNGQQTRSMIAAYELVQRGFKNVQVLKGGYFEWVANEREIETFE
ncbi:Rhodanese-like domain-containing protein 14, chloroplastic [Tetrabaena socialis]|uniref:Rhodanese-like domain-containing protein 14, chloroplastic n=1 Tax=Tetrabaena socialis TaxID=47790 RepID=A0A2J8AEN8_9CHLO|nr:Rhodanese-like domain-containing protein 14, chloroplastic [Tetrabaena socialis]|eukprot:PNH10969.1 Rhodanese-like domain-containing protein 14, chloroplastic [Tetrabaena socialis]